MNERLKSLWRGFVEKQKFSVTDSDDGSERWYMYISPARLLVGMVTLVLVLFIVVFLLIAYTPIADTIPGYPGRRSREALIQNILRLDSLERRMADLTVYSDNIALIMEGKTPLLRDASRIGDSIRMQDKTLVPPSSADSVLRALMEGGGEYSLAGSVASANSSQVVPEFVPPVTGMVQNRFSPVSGMFGVEIVTAVGSPVVAVRDGSVILSTWTPDAGHIVGVQHSGNLVSIYKRLSASERSVGVRVKTGESIGIAGVAGDEGTAGPFEFELWYNGTPVDPQNYIVF